MVKLFGSCVIVGVDFSPNTIRHLLIDSVMVNFVYERGDLGKTGRYKNLPYPHGVINLQGDLTNILDIVFKIKANNEIYIDDVFIDLNVEYSGSCNFELPIKIINMLSELNLTIGISCFEALS
jgi:hypothetical protein